MADWDDALDAKGRAFVIARLHEHTQVDEVAALAEQVYKVTRRGGKTDIVFFVTNVYMLSLADYFAIRDKHPDVDCIVVLSSYSSYSSEAKQQGLEDDVGIFDFAGFMGALHRDGPDFARYRRQS